MPYDAITIDANIAIQSGINLESGLLAQLFQFKDGPVDFIISDVVFNEIAKHLSKNTKRARDAALAAIRNAVDLELVESASVEALTKSVEGMVDSRDAVRGRLQRFLEATGATAVPSSLVSAEEVMRLYFQAKPPFEEAGPKKSEFPDAVALLSLEKWAAERGKTILAVSADKGWKAYADGSPHLDVEVDLATALATLQQHGDEAAAAVAQLLHAIDQGEAADNEQELRRFLADSLEQLNVHAEADSYFYFELDSVHLELDDVSFTKIGDEYDVTIVRIGRDEVVTQVGVVLSVRAEAEFSLSVEDSIDKDYVGMGGATAERELGFDTYALITVHGNLAGSVEDLAITAAEVVEEYSSIDFGTLDIEHADEEDYRAWLEEDLDADVKADVDEDGRQAAGDPF